LLKHNEENFIQEAAHKFGHGILEWGKGWDQSQKQHEQLGIYS
jgi:hypothetical protein